MNKWNELSKEVSYALRHAPWEYELELDKEGWISVEQFIEALRCRDKWKDICEMDLHAMIQKSEKRRYEIKKGKIRALYGHSTPMKILKQEEVPPDILYHGTARRFLVSIRSEGLLPAGRHYVHLAQDMETAVCVGKRHDNNPCILIINAKRAWCEGVKFYRGSENIWLANSIPSKYIKQTNL